MVRVVTPGLHKGAPYAPLTESQAEHRRPQPLRPHHHPAQGRRLASSITASSTSSATRKASPARIERIEYDPNRTAHIALLCYVDGERRYIIAPKGAKVGDQLMAGRDAPIKTGNSLPLRNIPIGSTVHCIEMKPGKGAQMARAAGASAQLVAREGVYATLRLRSGEMRKVPAECRATIGEVGNSEHNLEKLGKAGASALARCASDRSRRGDEPGRPSARRWRRPRRTGQPASGVAVGHAEPRVTRHARTSARRSSSCAIAGADRPWHVH